MRKSILVFALIFYSSIGSLYSQKTPTETSRKDHKNNAIYIELFGNSGTYSLNYERALYTKEDHSEKLALSAGFNLTFSIFQTKIPVELKYIFGQKHAFELGTGLTLGTANWFDKSEPDKLAGSYFVIRTGYRYTKRGLVIRAAPLLHIPKTWSSALWGGVSIGYSF